MSWFRLDDQGCFHAKVVKAGNEAYGAWVRAGQWASSHLTDGAIPEHVALTIAPKRVWLRLVEAGLLEHRSGDGDPFVIHDFLDYNPSRADVEASREKRARAGAIGGKRRKNRDSSKQSASSLLSKEQATSQANAEHDAKQNSTPSRSRPDPVPIPDLDPPPQPPALALDPPPPRTVSDAAAQEPLCGPLAGQNDRVAVPVAADAMTPPPRSSNRVLDQPPLPPPGHKALTDDERAVLIALRTEHDGALMSVSTAAFAREIASQCGPMARLELADVLVGIRIAADDEMRTARAGQPRRAAQLEKFVLSVVRARRRGDGANAASGIPPDRPATHRSRGTKMVQME